MTWQADWTCPPVPETGMNRFYLTAQATGLVGAGQFAFSQVSTAWLVLVTCPCG